MTEWTQRDIDLMESAVVIVCVFLFAISMWTIDISVSTMFMQIAGYPVQTEGLIFVGLEPRVTYHAALIIQTAALLIIAYLFMKRMIEGRK